MWYCWWWGLIIVIIVGDFFIACLLYTCHCGWVLDFFFFLASVVSHLGHEIIKCHPKHILLHNLVLFYSINIIATWVVQFHNSQINFNFFFSSEIWWRKYLPHVHIFSCHWNLTFCFSFIMYASILLINYMYNCTIVTTASQRQRIIKLTLVVIELLCPWQDHWPPQAGCTSMRSHGHTRVVESTSRLWPIGHSGATPMLVSMYG